VASLSNIRKRFSVRHILVGVGPASTGLGPVALNLAREQRALGMDAKIWCLDIRAEIELAAESSGLSPDCIVGFPKTGPSFLGYSLAMERAATESEGHKIDVIHQHGIWTGISRVTNQWRGKIHGPTVIAPHGMLEAWALKRSGWKKWLALAAYESKNLKKAACLHATSQLEAQGFRAYGSVNPIAVINNGVSDKWLQSVGDGISFRTKYGLDVNRRLLLYVGRITPVKNPGMFIQAMANIKEDLRDWLFVIVGKDEFAHKREVETKIKFLQMEPWVRFLGSVPEEDKRNAYDAAEIFVLPSHREASPIVVLEALGAAVPVLTTKGVPWEDLENYGCGWRPEVGVDSISQALKEAISKSSDELRAMGRRGHQLMYERYRWSHAAQKSLLLYEWLLGRADKPEFIFDA